MYVIGKPNCYLSDYKNKKYTSAFNQVIKQLNHININIIDLRKCIKYNTFCY